MANERRIIWADPCAAGPLLISLKRDDDPRQMAFPASLMWPGTPSCSVAEQGARGERCARYFMRSTAPGGQAFVASSTAFLGRRAVTLFLIAACARSKPAVMTGCRNGCLKGVHGAGVA